MRHHISSRVVLVVITLFLAVSFLSSADARQKQGKTPQEIYKEILLHLEEIEQISHKSRIPMFKVRDSLNELYSHISGDLTDPFNKSTGQLSVPDHEKGIGMYDSCDGLVNGRLKSALLRIIQSHVSVGYQRAQDLVFGDIDNSSGYVRCVYTGRKLKTSGEPSASNMNIEHTWPQSHGAVGIAKSDLHHLFPTDSKSNSRRGNHPFGYVKNPKWEEGGSKTDGRFFDVREDHRGNTARAMFYFSVRYGKNISSSEESVLRRWHKEDPITASEKKRNDRVHNFQNNRNPFVDRPEFIDAISDF